MKGQLNWLGGREEEANGFLFGEFSFQAKREIPLLPIELRGDEEVNEEGIIAMEIDELSIASVVLHSRSHTAPEGLKGGGIDLEGARTKGEIINHHTGFRMLGSEDVIVKGSLVVIRFLSGGLPAKEMFCELELVIGFAGFRSGIC